MPGILVTSGQPSNQKLGFMDLEKSRTSLGKSYSISLGFQYCHFHRIYMTYINISERYL